MAIADTRLAGRLIVALVVTISARMLDSLSALSGKCSGLSRVRSDDCPTLPRVY